MVNRTDADEGHIAETVRLTGHHGDSIRAYFLHPQGDRPRPGVVLIHHMPGWSEWYREVAFKFVRRGYDVICPNLYERAGHGTPEDVAAMVRNQGGVPDDQVIGDVEAAIRFLREQPRATGRIGVFGTCSGGRHAYLVACRSQERVDAVLDLWGGGVVMRPDELTPNRPVAPIEYTESLTAPLLGIFGNDDRSPSPEAVDETEATLQRLNKAYEFHRYDGAGHGFFYDHRPNFRQEQAADGWQRVWAFLDKHLKQ